jgi:histidyl-tRNA synthetase
LVVIPTGVSESAVGLTQRLRHAGFTVELGYSGNMKKRMARANKLNARAAIILGEEEWSRQAVAVRDLDTGEQEEVPLAVLEERLSRFR